jgi:predicted Zn-dependent protease
MFGPSFRLSVTRVVPCSAVLGAACLLAGLTLAGCSGGSAPPVTLRGDGFSFSAPGGWKVTRTATSIGAAHGGGAVSVTTFRLTRTYRPQLWNKAVKELNGVAAKLAVQLHGTVVAGRTVQVGGTTARQYDLAFTRNGDRLVERITFVLRGRREFELLCRFKEGKDDRACAALQTSFRDG